MDTIAPFRISVCGIEELAGHSGSRVSHVLSILDPDWPVPEAFGDFGEHEKLELRFHDVIEPTEGQIPPSEEQVVQLLAFGRDLMQEPPADAHLLVHCHAGISRSTASMALILAQGLPHRSATEIMDEVQRIREKAWPNLRIIEMGDALLGRGGTLVAAAHEAYRLQLQKRPHLADFMNEAGRQREVQAATRCANPFPLPAFALSQSGDTPVADPKAEVAPSYGEGDIEAKAMTEAANGKAPEPAAKAETPPPDAALPASGTTETDLSRNLEHKVDRQKP